MVGFLIKLFQKNKTSENEKRSVCASVCSIVGILLNVLLFAAKLLCGLFTGSIAVSADAFNNLSDAGSSIVTLVGFRLSEKKPDPGHPFGHGRIEYISGLIVSFMIILMGIELAKTSVEGLIEPAIPEFKVLSIVILSVSILVKLYICLYNRKYGKWINSSAMIATASDSLGDVASTAVVLISLIISHFTGFVYVDAICGLAVSVFILFAGVRASLETVSPLLGQPPSADFVKKVEEIALSNEKIIGLHDMIVHDYGPGRVMVSLHCEVSSEDDVIEIHEIIDGLEIRIANELNCNALIHMDPVDVNDEALKELRPIVLAAVRTLHENATFHDLRVVRASDHLNVLFDVLLPFEAKISETEAISRIVGEIKSKKPECECIIKIDTDFIGRG